MKQMNVELCIIGAAGSGLTAAVRAYESGIKNVIVLEKNRLPGGCTKMAWGIFGVESDAEKRLGCTETVDQCFNYHMEMTNYQCDGKLVRDWIGSSGKVMNWIESLGVSLDQVHACSGDFRTYHTSGQLGVEATEKTGGQIIKKLVERCKEYGIPVMTQTKANHLLRDETGRVFGVSASNADGDFEIHANNVVIATGSMSANMDLVKRYYPNKYWGDEIWITARVMFPKDGEACSGDGLTMIEELGVNANDYTSILYIGPMVPCNKNVNYFVKMPEILKVNRDGKRFVREDLNVRGQWGWMQGDALDRQPGRVCYAIVDAETINKIASGEERTAFHEKQAAMEYLRLNKKTLPAEDQNNPLAWVKYMDKDIEDVIAKGEAVRVESLEEAAKFIGCDAEELRASVAEYNGYCADGYDADFLKESKYLIAQQKAPYYIIRCWAAVDTVIGGVRIDSKLRAIDNDQRPIPGLYCVGVAASGWCAQTYSFWGSEMSWTFYSGYTVVDRILEEKKGK